MNRPDRQSRRARLCAILLLSSLMAAPAAAAAKPDHRLTEALIDDELITALRDIAGDPVVVMAVANQNAEIGTPDQVTIDELDRRWGQEAGAHTQRLIAATVSRPLSLHLKRLQARSVGLIVEMIVVDQNGLNAGVSNITTDYWQGDEAKFRRTFGVGPEAIFIDAAQWHRETSTWRAQISMTLVDPADGRKIGAATFEINLTELQRRRAAR